MFTTTLSGMLLPGFLLGLLHALDVDHVAAVSSLAARQTGWRACTGYATRWASGHAAVLMFVALLTTSLGAQLPEAAGALAERMVGAILLVTGASLLWVAHGSRGRLPWTVPGLALAHGAVAPVRPHRHGHAPLLVGMVHGMAGSAAALALIPVAMQQSGAALSYVGIFSLGVGVAMFLVAALLGQAQQTIAQRHAGLIETYRTGLALAAMALGLYWLLAA